MSNMKENMNKYEYFIRTVQESPALNNIYIRAHWRAIIFNSRIEIIYP